MIISASRRTDIPAFFASWLMDCIRRGEVRARNPFNPTQEKVVSLRPADIEAIVFWTRNATPLIRHLPELDDRGYRYIFLYTINGYGSPLEPNSPPVDNAIETFRNLSERVGASRVIWRFDPILFPEGEGTDWITSRFDKIAQSLYGSTRRVIISFLDRYKKVARRLTRLAKDTGLTLKDVTGEEESLGHIAAVLATVAAESGIKIFSCAEKVDLLPYGIKPGSCIDAHYLNETFCLTIPASKDKSQRPLCRCAPSQDIGAYNTCRHECVYCYAI